MTSVHPKESITLSKAFIGCLLLAVVVAFHYVYNAQKYNDFIYTLPPPGTWFISAIATFLMIFYALHVDGFINFVKREVDAFVVNNRLQNITTFKKFKNRISPIQ